MPPVSRIGALKIADKKKWTAEVRRVLKGAKGDLDAASKALEVSRRQLSRWIECSERKGGARTSLQTDRCGKCAGCEVLGPKLIAMLGQPGRRWPEDSDKE